MSTELDLGWLDPHLGGLQRLPTDGVGSGLSRGIADRLGVDAVLLRVVFVVLAFCAGLGLALYAWGTVLSRGPQGTRPIDQALPRFREWSPGMQKLLVIVSTVALTGTIGAAFPLPWGAGVLVLIALLLVRRRSQRGPAPQDAWPPPGQPARIAAAPYLGAPVDDQALVEQWRRSISDAVGNHRAAVPAPNQLPEVDLYAPVEETPLRPAGPRPKSNWWAGGAILIAMGLTAWASRNLLMFTGVEALAATTAVGGFGAVICALTARRWRVPRPVLATLVVPMILAGWLAVQTTMLPAADTPGTLTVSVVADNAIVDLGDMDLSGYDTVRVDALMADVQLILPGPVNSITTDIWAANVTDLGRFASGTAEGTALDLDLDISARLSSVTIEEQS